MLKFKFHSTLPPGLFLSVAVFSLVAAETTGSTALKPVYNPFVAPASEEGELAIKKFSVPPGFKVELFAAEPHLANPVAFHIDERGRFYVCETFRLQTGVIDIRGIMNWLDEDLACRTVDDRLAMMKRHLGAKISDYEKESERIRLIEDRDGDGKADVATVFAEGFNRVLDGLGAGVLARGGQVYYANLPNLWLLKDTNGDGIADFRQSLHHGYGTRIGFIGHDMHGLIFGPEGKLYFSIGDRGASVTQNGKTIGSPDTGSVFRCEPDGSELEVFAYGLRNPQELAFDQNGNLFTGDNNSDGGDKARWVYVVEGGDSGWRIGYQFIRSPTPRGPWNAEKLWHPQWAGQAAYLVPPIINLADGPSGLTYYPGTGLPDKYQGHFFLADFKGAAVNSGVHSFALKAKGASFELIGRENFFWHILATDVDFGPDGAIYVSDWVKGWDQPHRGRIYRAVHSEQAKQPIVAETRKLIAEGMTHRSLEELGRLLAHEDRRLRQAAQFALADKGLAAIPGLAAVAGQGENQLARLHAIWGLGQVARAEPLPLRGSASTALDPLVRLLADSGAEIRAQAAKVVGEHRYAPAYEALIRGLTDEQPRVRFYAALSLGKLRRKEAVPALLAMVRSNADQDPYLRHAAVMALTWINDIDSLAGTISDATPAVRMAGLLAMRRLQRPEIAGFLKDPEPLLVLEAARAINDEPIHGVQAELASLIAQPITSEPLFQRVLNANFRDGTAETAKALAGFAARSDAPELFRAAALRALGDWPKPSGHDRVTGLWRPLAHAREEKTPAAALRPVLVDILKTAPTSVRIGAAKASGQLFIGEAAGALYALFQDTQLGGAFRAECLKTLGELKAERLTEAVRSAQADENESVRKEGARLAARLEPGNAANQLEEVLKNGTLSERQTALATLATVGGEVADGLISQWLDKLLAGQLAREVQLDALEAAGKRSDPGIKEKLQKYQARKPADDPLANFRETLYGGNAESGRKLFLERAELACVRCHRADGEGGEIGPNLAGIGTRQQREYFLEAILLPNKIIAAGFENILVELKDGKSYAGIVKSENDLELELNSLEEGITKIKKSEIQARERGLSAMPEGMDELVAKTDLRDLIEFLSSLK